MNIPFTSDPNWRPRQQNINPQSSISPSGIFAVDSILVFFIAGTGGMITPHSLTAYSRQVYEPRIHKESSDLSNIDNRSPAEHLIFIRNILGLNTSELAAILNVTRPTIYAWQEGQEPKPEALMGIQQISKIAGKVQSFHIQRFDTLMRRPIFEGISLLDKLKRNEDITKHLVVLKDLAEKENLGRNTKKGKNKQPIYDAINDYAMPLYKRDNNK
ncbi:MAG: hypothetical protein KIT27_06235 [Legionellales bacterium]|nr:hypothetical protein [Legionellales bacterium]